MRLGKKNTASVYFVNKTNATHYIL